MNEFEIGDTVQIYNIRTQEVIRGFFERTVVGKLAKQSNDKYAISMHDYKKIHLIFGKKTNELIIMGEDFDLIIKRSCSLVMIEKMRK